jgi:ABC-type branched-subunit amino acid transport system substrate-binding protein
MSSAKRSKNTSTMWPGAANQPVISGRLGLWILLAGLVGVTLSSCASVDPVVKIGLVAPFEGRYRSLGYDVIYSARMAIREVNGAGGIGPYRVALVALDDGGDPNLAEKTAESLVIDPSLMAVIGHWLPETTAAASGVYVQGDVPLVAGGERPFEAMDPAALPAAFRSDYESVTPFDEVPGPYAGPAYDAMYLILDAMAKAYEADGRIDRGTVGLALQNSEYEGITGAVYQP